MKQNYISEHTARGQALSFESFDPNTSKDPRLHAVKLNANAPYDLYIPVQSFSQLIVASNAFERTAYVVNSRNYCVKLLNGLNDV